jgi:hypothetical protein
MIERRIAFLAGSGRGHNILISRKRMMSAPGATRTCRNVRYPFAMGWQADFEVAALNRLDL